MSMEYWCFFHSYGDKTAKLSDQELGRLVRALNTFSETGEPQQLAGRESIAYDFIADDIEKAKARYAERCKTNSNNRQRPSTNDNDRQRTMTNDDERQRPSTNDDETPQTKNKKQKQKEKEKEKDIDVSLQTHERPRVPYRQIVEVYNDVCIDLPRVHELNENRKTLVAARYRESDCSIDAMRDVFEAVQRSDFLCGRTGTWKASFDWIIKASNWLKIKEGNYENRGDDRGAAGTSDAGTECPWDFSADAL